MIYYSISKSYPKKLGQAANKILGGERKNIPRKNRTGGSRIDIFWCSPHLFNQWRGEAPSRGERKIRDELSFQASDRLRKKQTSSDEPESLASRIYRTLEGVPRNGQWERGTSKCAHSGYQLRSAQR
jgi:hypothetical protein